ncbi:hypothetical protein ACLK1S_04940 [Escherichia coli]
MKTLRENGTYNEIYKKWFGTETREKRYTCKTHWQFPLPMGRGLG